MALNFKFRANPLVRARRMPAASFWLQAGACVVVIWSLLHGDVDVSAPNRAYSAGAAPSEHAASATAASPAEGPGTAAPATAPAAAGAPGGPAGAPPPPLPRAPAPEGSKS